MKKYIVANWKMNPGTRAEALKLFRTVAKVKHGKNLEVVICPPFVYLEDLVDILSARVHHLTTTLGAQDDFPAEKGAYTGEVSAKMLKDIGVKYVILGHSERRTWLKESDALINKKVLATLHAELTPILCVGEPASVRNKGIAEAKRFIAGQLKKDLKGIGHRYSHNHGGKLIVAYEPIWAISTNKNAKPDNPVNAAEMISFVKHFLHTTYHLLPTVLYGGSTNAENIEGFLKEKVIDGALIGGASLNAHEFGKMMQKINKLI